MGTDLEAGTRLPDVANITLGLSTLLVFFNNTLLSSEC